MALANGQAFSVVIKFTTPGDWWPVPAQSWIPGYDYEVPLTPVGVTFISYDGSSWYDLTDFDSYGAINIHAFVK